MTVTVTSQVSRSKNLPYAHAPSARLFFAIISSTSPPAPPGSGAGNGAAWPSLEAASSEAARGHGGVGQLPLNHMTLLAFEGGKKRNLKIIHFIHFVLFIHFIHPFHQSIIRKSSNHQKKIVHHVTASSTSVLTTMSPLNF